MSKSVKELYREKLMSADEAVKFIQPGDGIAVGGFIAEPSGLLNALRDYTNLSGNRIYRQLATTPAFDLPPTILKQYSFFLSGFDRYALNQQPGIIDLIPNNLSDCGRVLAARETDPVFITLVSPMDEHGYFSFGPTLGSSPTMRRIAKHIIVEVNENVPVTGGEDNYLHISQVTALVENNVPLFEVPQEVPNEKDLKIGQFVADMVEDGDTIQLGIGTMPNAVAGLLYEKKELSFYSEMIPEGLVDLYAKGVITNKNKTLNPGMSTANFVGGTKKLYDFLHNNRTIELLSIERTNEAFNIAQLDHFISINTAIEVDLYGQVNAEMIDGKVYSSTGGQSEFARGAYRAAHGKSVICLYSTAKDDEVSTIVPFFKPGTVVSTSKNDVDMIVTEYGVARLKNKSFSERVDELISVAHPKFREKLKKQAREIGLVMG